MVVTPPYRFANPRYVDTSYGVSAEAALAMNRRDFFFVASPEHYDDASRALEILLWPGSRDDTELDEANSILAALPTYSGTFWIEEGGASPPDTANPLGLIQWLSFRAHLCVPAA